MNPGTAASLLDPFIKAPEIRERFTTEVHAPAALVFEVAREFDLLSIPAVRGIFWLRATLMRARAGAPLPGQSLIAMTRSIGWGALLDQPGRAYVSGASCQPWLPDVVFSPLTAEGCARYSEPNRVKIVWSLEVESRGSELTRLSTETRVAATDEEARARFRSYWRLVGIGIRMIRWLTLPAIRREAERRWRARALAA